MTTFQDLEGRTWPVRITVADALALREIGVDVATLDENTLAKLCDDPVTLVAALWVVCRPHDRHGLSETDFARAIAGDVLAEATNAFLEALADFFPSPKRRVLKAALRAAERIVETNSAKAIQTLANLETSGVTPSSSPGSSDSHPGPIPSESSSGPSRENDSTTGTTPALSSPNKQTSTPTNAGPTHPTSSTPTDAPANPHP